VIEGGKQSDEHQQPGPHPGGRCGVFGRRGRAVEVEGEHRHRGVVLVGVCAGGDPRDQPLGSGLGWQRQRQRRGQHGGVEGAVDAVAAQENPVTGAKVEGLRRVVQIGNLGRAKKAGEGLAVRVSLRLFRGEIARRHLAL